MTKNVSNKLNKIEFKGFPGIDRSYYAGKAGFERIENFRLDHSGALVKRPGKLRVAKFSHPITAALEYTLNAPNRPHADCLVAEPPNLHALSLQSSDDMIIATDLGSVNTRVALTLFRLKPYLFDGKSIRTISYEGDSMIEVQGYAPLYGKDWDPVTAGPVNEEPNLLGGELRINYKVKNATTSLYVGFQALSVVRVEVNGTQVYGYSLDGNYIKGSFPAESSVDVWIKRSFSKGPIFKCCAAACVGGGAEERLVVYKNSEAGSLVFCSAPVSDAELKKSKKGFQNSLPLYFPESLALELGSYYVSAVCSCGDGFVLFCANQTMLAKIDGKNCELYPLSRTVGCVATKACFSKNRQVYTFSSDGIYRFDVDLSEPYDTVVEKISSVLEGNGDPMIDTSCMIFENSADGEIWFCGPGNIYVYNLARSAFYVYTGLYTRSMISLYSSVYLFEWYDVWRFDESHYFDEDDGAVSNIRAIAVSRWLDFGEVEKYKKNLTVHTVSVDDDCEVFLKVNTDSELECDFQVSGDGAYNSIGHDFRVARCRFRLAKFTFTAEGQGQPKIYAAVLTAQS